jgi:hypothetical protein
VDVGVDVMLEANERVVAVAGVVVVVVSHVFYDSSFFGPAGVDGIAVCMINTRSWFGCDWR